jgi:hypothetical protein
MLTASIFPRGDRAASRRPVLCRCTTDQNHAKMQALMANPSKKRSHPVSSAIVSRLSGSASGTRATLVSVTGLSIGRSASLSAGATCAATRAPGAIGA